LRSHFVAPRLLDVIPSQRLFIRGRISRHMPSPSCGLSVWLSRGTNGGEDDRIMKLAPRLCAAA
jgi:hypothetical protein